MELLQNLFKEELIEQAKAATSEEEIELILESIPEKIETLLSVLPKNILDEIKYEAPAKLHDNRVYDEGFKERNFNRWEKPFNLLDLLIEISIESGEELKNRVRNKATYDNNILFGVIVRLHARACLISKEIITLLKSGYPDGAHARWRALHETNVISRFIFKHGTEAAKNYLEHEIVESYKGAKQLNDYQPRLNVKRFSDEELSSMRSQYWHILDKHGDNFKQPYGWANNFFSHDYIKFDQIEKDVELDHWRPYYKWASQGIHPNSKSIINNLGLSESTKNILLVGPSNSGMTDPGHSTAISLMQATNTLLMQYANIDSVIVMKLLLSLSQEVGDEFLQVEKHLK